jgi:iron complex outermembrane recepter protein
MPQTRSLYLRPGYIRRLISGLGVFTVVAAGAQPRSSPSDLKRLELDELLETKVISVSRTPEDWRKAPTAIGILASEEIRRTGATRLPELLRYAPGLYVGRDISGGYAVAARGFAGAAINKMQVLLDGRSLYTPLFSGVVWEVQDVMIEDLERVEVVRGPGATMWGANAVNGVINIVSKSARDTQGVLVKAGGGYEETGLAAVRYGGRLGDSTYYRAYFKYIDRDGQQLPGGREAPDVSRQRQSGFRLDSYPGASDQLTLQADFYTNEFGSIGLSDADNQGWNVLTRWTHDFSDTASLQVQAYYERAIRDIPLQFREDRRTRDIEVQHNFHLGKRHQFVWGLNYRHSEDWTEAGRVIAFFPTARRIELFSGFVQDQITLWRDRATLYLGSKFEHNDFTGFEWQPSARLSFQPTPRQTLWAAYSRAVRTPTRYDVDARFRPSVRAQNIFIRGYPAFRSETVRAVELGYRVQPHATVFVDLAAYSNRYDHIRTFEGTPPFGQPMVVGNLREAETSGVELAVTVQLANWWSVSGSYTHQEQELRLKPGSRHSPLGLLEANDPNDFASLRTSLNLKGNIELDLGVRYFDALPSPAIPSYTEADARIAWRPVKNLQLALVGQNLLHDAHPEFAGSSVLIEVERSIFGTVTWTF